MFEVGSSCFQVVEEDDPFIYFIAKGLARQVDGLVLGLVALGYLFLNDDRGTRMLSNLSLGLMV